MYFSDIYLLPAKKLGIKISFVQLAYDKFVHYIVLLTSYSKPLQNVLFKHLFTSPQKIYFSDILLPAKKLGIKIGFIQLASDKFVHYLVLLTWDSKPLQNVLFKHLFTSPKVTIKNQLWNYFLNNYEIVFSFKQS